MNPRWQVSRRGTFADEWIEDALDALAHASIRWMIETKPVAGRDTEHRPTTTVWVRAADDQAATALLQTVLEPYGSFYTSSATKTYGSVYLSSRKQSNTPSRCC